MANRRGSTQRRREPATPTDDEAWRRYPADAYSPRVRAEDQPLWWGRTPDERRRWALKAGAVILALVAAQTALLLVNEPAFLALGLVAPVLFYWALADCLGAAMTRF